MALPLAIGTALLAVIAAIILFGSSGGKHAPPPEPSRPMAAANTPAGRAERAMPPAEQSFIAAIEQGKAAYEAGPGDAEKAAARATRAGALCQAVPNPHFFAWSGVVAAVSADAAGPPFVSIEIAPKTRLTTQDDTAAGAGTIDPDVLPALSTLQPGQAVAFTGIFRPARPGDADCYRQAMPTPDEAMAAPVFVIGLYSIAPFKGPAPAERSK